jgi:4-aminobutyrate aminotransferase-like enzyme
MPADSLLERRYRVLGRNSPLFYDKPLHLVRGEGVWLFDADGKRYLDAYNNVPHVGHCHPRVVAALSRQAATLNTHTRYLDETVVAYAERLTSLFDGELSMAMFCCTGSEANELALRIARDCSGGQGIISTAWAYHGNTAAVMQVSSLFTPEDQRGPYIRTVRPVFGLPACSTAPPSPAKACRRCPPDSWPKRSHTCTPPADSSLRMRCRRASAVWAATCGDIKSWG